MRRSRHVIHVHVSELHQTLTESFHGFRICLDPFILFVLDRALLDVEVKVLMKEDDAWFSVRDGEFDFGIGETGKERNRAANLVRDLVRNGFQGVFFFIGFAIGAAIVVRVVTTRVPGW